MYILYLKKKKNSCAFLLSPLHLYTSRGACGPNLQLSPRCLMVNQLSSLVMHHTTNYTSKQQLPLFAPSSCDSYYYYQSQLAHQTPDTRHLDYARLGYIPTLVGSSYGYQSQGCEYVPALVEPPSGVTPRALVHASPPHTSPPHTTPRDPNLEAVELSVFKQRQAIIWQVQVNVALKRNRSAGRRRLEKCQGQWGFGLLNSVLSQHTLTERETPIYRAYSGTLLK